MELQSGSKAIILYNQRILLMLRDMKPEIVDPNTWTFPGGGIEMGETPLEAIKRELDEEISVTPTSIYFIGRATYPDTSVTHMYISWLKLSEYTKLKLGNEGQAIDFFDLDTTLKLDLSYKTREYLNKSHRQIRKFMDNPSSLQPFDTVI